MPSYRAGALVGRMRLTYDYREFQFRDPAPPTELLPAAGWATRRTRCSSTPNEILDPAAESY